jgi:hypothetical protein
LAVCHEEENIEADMEMEIVNGDMKTISTV